MMYSRHRYNGASGSDFIKSLILLTALTVFSAYFIKYILWDTSKTNLLYLQILNHTLPAAKTMPYNSNEFSEYKISLKSRLLQTVGIDLTYPVSIIKKEIHISEKDPTYSEIEPQETQKNNILPFNFDILNLIKQAPGETTQESGTKNPPTTDSNVSTPAANQPNKVNVLEPSLIKPLDISKPEVLIYHTHTSEDYNTSGINTKNSQAKDVCAVGDLLTAELEAYGISTIHDKSIHDTLYIQAYSRSAETLNKYLSKYKDFKLIIDLHRDSGVDKKIITASINKEAVAKIMFVMSSGNPHFKQNQTVVNKLKEISDSLYPQFCRDTYLYPNKANHFNQEKSNNAVLIEVGSVTNTSAEAAASAKYIGRIIAEYINK